MKDMINSATIKFAKDKGLVLIRGSLVSRDQLTNIVDGNVVIDNVSFGIARRINRFTDMIVGLGDTFFNVHNNDEEALTKAYECESYATKPEVEIVTNTEIIDAPAEPAPIETIVEEEVAQEEETAEVEEEVVEAPVEEEVVEESEDEESEDESSEEETNVTEEEKPEETPAQHQVTRNIPQPKHGKKHRH